MEFPQKGGEENKRKKIMVRILPNLIKANNRAGLEHPRGMVPGHPTTTTDVKIWMLKPLESGLPWVLCPQIQRTDCIFLKNNPMSNWTCAVKTQGVCSRVNCKIEFIIYIKMYDNNSTREEKGKYTICIVIGFYTTY